MRSGDLAEGSGILDLRRGFLVVQQQSQAQPPERPVFCEIFFFFFFVSRGMPASFLL